jgi:hypothetical protein
MGQALGVLRLLIPKLLSLRAWAMFLGLLGAGILSSRCQGVCGPRVLMRGTYVLSGMVVTRGLRWLHAGLFSVNCESFACCLVGLCHGQGLVLHQSAPCVRWKTLLRYLKKAKDLEYKGLAASPLLPSNSLIQSRAFFKVLSWIQELLLPLFNGLA